MISTSVWDFHDFHLFELPRRLANGNAVLAAEQSRELVPICLRWQHTDEAYTYVPGAMSVQIMAGTEADLLIELEENFWRRLLTPGANDSRELEQRASGSLDEWQKYACQRWAVVLRVMYHGQGLTTD